MTENQRRTLKAYLEDGGVKGRFFKDPSNDNVYQVFLVHSLDDPVPDCETFPPALRARFLDRSPPGVTVTYLATNINCHMAMMPHIYDLEATSEEVERAQRSGLASALAQKVAHKATHVMIDD